MNITEQIDAAFDLEDWRGARRLILGELRRNPDDHWLLTRLGTTFYEQRKYPAALNRAWEAARKAPDCPLVLWDLAGALDANEMKTPAIGVYRSLVERGVDAVANDECGEGKDWAESLLADCKYRIAMCYRDLGDDAQYQTWMDQYQADVAKGIASIYQNKDTQYVVDSRFTIINTSLANAENNVTYSPGIGATSFGSSPQPVRRILAKAHS